MIFQYLRDESPRRVKNARRFANTVSGRPHLAALVKEVRHAEVGFADFAGYSEPFYKALIKLPNLETLVMRKSLHPSTAYSPQAALQEVLTQICNEYESGMCQNHIFKISWRIWAIEGILLAMRRVRSALDSILMKRTFRSKVGRKIWPSTHI
ncbi:hypothetical protein N7501_000920 [Penicillium viridicatum]|nr:hypothetical protein N7501_000920 [Penicillium viridicatum]